MGLSFTPEAVAWLERVSHAHGCEVIRLVVAKESCKSAPALSLMLDQRRPTDVLHPFAQATLALSRESASLLGAGLIALDEDGDLELVSASRSALSGGG